MATILSEVSVKPPEQVRRMLDAFPIPETDCSIEESERMLADFREEAPGILGWWMEGRDEVRQILKDMGNQQ